MKINILGIGNVLFGDEGFGVKVVKQIETNSKYPDYVNVIDGGTQGIYLLDYVESPDYLLIFDAIIPVEYKMDIHIYRHSRLPAFIHRKLSSHQIGLSELISLAQLHGKMPTEIALIGIPPKNLELGSELSTEVEILIPAAIHSGDQIINEWLAKGD